MPANWAGKSFECTDGIEAEDTSVFDLWQAAGHDCAPDMEWYTKQTVLGAVYTTTELYMLTDYTPRCKTWNWINNCSCFLQQRDSFVANWVCRLLQVVFATFQSFDVITMNAKHCLNMWLYAPKWPGYHETWTFLESQTRDAVNCCKSREEMILFW